MHWKTCERQVVQFLGNYNLANVRRAAFGHCEGQAERGDWCSLCLMYSSAPPWRLGLLAQEWQLAAAAADLQRCLAHPEIHHGSVSAAHRDAAPPPPQITANDLFLSASRPSLPSSAHYFLRYISLLGLFSFNMRPRLSSHSLQNV